LSRLRARLPGTLSAMRCSIFKLSAPALLVLVSACGGGGGDTPGTPATPSSPSAPASTGSSPAPIGSNPAPTGSSPAPTASADITCGLANFEADALRLINERRAAGATCGAKGVFASAPPLAWQSQLTSTAYAHSRDMADHNYFAHDSQDGRTMASRVTAAGYSWSTVGENIAAGYGTVQHVIDGWMASDGHCANLMNPRFTEFGMACARNDASTYRTYWTQDLARP
jgi:uncharacterized protein YkwD